MNHEKQDITENTAENTQASVNESAQAAETPDTPQTVGNSAETVDVSCQTSADEDQRMKVLTPPPEFYQFMLKSLAQGRDNTHRNRPLNPESANCAAGATPYLILKESQQVHDLEQLLPNPVRKRDTVDLERADSFIRYVNAHKIPDTSAIYQSSNSKGETSFKAIIDDHQIGENGTPNWQSHKVIYTPKTSREWCIWNEWNKREASQEHFAAFIEDNMPDIIEPNGSILLEIVRTLESKKNVNFKSGVRLDNGDFSIQYEETSTAKAGEKGTLDIPQIIKLSIPVYDGGANYEVEARFRYRISDGRLRMWYELVRLQDIIKHATDIISKQIGQGIDGVPIYYGYK